MNRKAIVGLFAALLLSSCSLPPQALEATARAVTQTRGVLDRIAAGTLVAIEDETAQAPPASDSSPMAGASLDVPGRNETTPTPTPAQVWVEVKVDTNCRLGPGLEFEMVGALFVGERTRVLQRSSIPNYWVVDNPDRPGHTCYLWGKYAALEGDIGSLPLDVPPTATPRPGAISGWVYVDLNANGIRDPEEIAPEGVVRLLLKVGECPGDATLRVVEANSYGRIMIQPLLAGDYCLVVDPTGIELNPQQIEIRLGSRQQLDEINFRTLP
jgi:hypothetical protein